MIAWSYGGGVQSVAIGVLIREGALPKPDLAVIADTSRERRTTWEYLRGIMQPFLSPLGIEIAVASHELARVDLYNSKNDLTLMPAYTEEGRLPGYCSGEWKRDVCERWLRLMGVKECDLWIGYSMDEIGRVSKKDHRPWCHYAYPLIDNFINRTMCKRIIETAGLPLPHKSRCWQCPHQNEEEWQETLADSIDGPLAIACDEEVRQNDPEKKGLYLHYSRLPLAQVAAGAENGLPLSPSRPCEGGFCFY